MPNSAVGKITKDSPTPRFVEVALPVPVRQTFTYRIPTGVGDLIKIGTRVTVPFGKRRLTGYAVSLSRDFDESLKIEESKLKNVIELLDDEPLLTEEIIQLTKWTSNYYLSSWGEVLKASLPAGINATIEEIVKITPLGKDEASTLKNRKTAPSNILLQLSKRNKPSVRELKKQFGTPKATRAIRSLEKRKLIERYHQTLPTKVQPKRRKFVRLLSNNRNEEKDKPLSETHKKILSFLRENNGEALFTDVIEKADVGASPINTLAKRGFLEVSVKEIFRDPLADSKIPEIKDLVLTDEQELVLNKIDSSIKKEKFETFLLHGVTGSGKTEVYIRAMKKVLSRGKSALMLVPEIALTPVFSKRLRAVFGKGVAILHSSLSAGERFDEWRRIRRGDAKVVIGTRSAVFAPLENLGLVVVDEEHDGSYRQHEMPFYNGRDVAIVRANFANAVVVLGSATPALETFHNSKTNKYKYLSLPNRIGNRPLAKAELIDMRKVFAAAGKDLIFSPQLLKSIEETHLRGEQSIILLNRRGFSQFVLCRNCGETMKCQNCDITLTYHRQKQKLICHYCDHQEKVPENCPECESHFLYFMGEGTEQIEKLLRQKFPKLTISRVDRDTTKRKRELENILSDFSDGKIDMLVGTQMLAKGHDFHNVTLVGVISVDLGLSLPDFRSAERTFQLLTQVAGRAGRGDLAGRVLIQTYYPEHYALIHSQAQNYDAFYAEEVEFRRKMHYPPFTALCGILIKSKNYGYALDTARILRTCLDSANADGNCIILGPAPASLPRLKGEYRIQILIKSEGRKTLREALNKAVAIAESKNCDMRTVFIKIDPINLL